MCMKNRSYDIVKKNFILFLYFNLGKRQNFDLFFDWIALLQFFEINMN